MNSSDYKREALEALRGRWRGVGLSVLVFYLISYIPFMVLSNNSLFTKW